MCVPFIDRAICFCWVLINIIYGYDRNLRKTPSGQVMEHSAARIYANPLGSLMVRPVVNATMLWYLSGLNVNDTAAFFTQDGVLWIVNIDRRLTGKNLTYRAVQDKGGSSEVNLTLEVTYGPDLPLKLLPDRSSYQMKSGDDMPDISCHVDCNPPCAITWGPDSPDQSLKLGQVTAKTSGEYTCYASNFGKTLTRSIFVNVVDEWSVTLSPPTTTYFQTTGESLPEIKCSALCFPPCTTAWNRQSTSDILKLGPVTVDMSGDYVCSASRNDTDKRIEKTITVFVKDDIAQTIAIAIIGSIQALTTLTVGIFGLCWCLRTKKTSFLKCLRRLTRGTMKNIHKQNESGSKPQITRQGTELDYYEDLDTNTRSISIIELYSGAKPGETAKTRQEVYENTVIA